VAVLGVGMFGMGAAVGSYGAYVPLLVAGGVSPADAGLGMSLMLLLQFLVAVPADRLTRSVPPTTVATAGFLVCGAGAAFGGLPTLEAALVSRSLVGVGLGAAFVAATKYVGRRTEGTDAATARAALGALFTLGFAVSLPLSPALVDRFGPVAPALFDAVVVLLGALGTLGLRRLPLEVPRPVSFYVRPVVSGVGLALGLVYAVAFGFVVVAATWYAAVLGDVTPPAITPAFVTPIFVTSVLVGFAVATVVGRLLGTRTTRRLGPGETVGASLAGLAVLFALAIAALLVDAPLLLAGALAASGLGFGLLVDPVFDLALTTLSADAGVTLTGVVGVGAVGASVFPWLVGWLRAASASYAAGFASLALATVVVWGLWRAVVQDVPGVGETDRR